MKPLNNPFTAFEEYDCFGCSPDNPLGLKMQFFEEGEEIISAWNPGIHHQGYHKVLHGGIQAALMDEIASWVVYVKLKTAGFTSKADVRYKQAVFVDRGTITLRAHCRQMRRNLADIAVQLFDSDHQLCSEGTFTYFTYTKEKAREHMYYPGPEAFLREP